MKLALAMTVLLLSTLASVAQPIRDDRYFVAWGPSSARDVMRAVRCPAPVGCRRAHHRRHRVIPVPKPRPKSLARGLVEEVRKALPVRGLAGIVPVLAAKASQIVSVCHARVISGVRHTYVAGTHRISLHASGKAVDISGNPRCIYPLLAGWPGGYSIDYARVKHVHISYDPQGRREMHARFVHGGHRHYRTMMARRHHYRRWHRRRS